MGNSPLEDAEWKILGLAVRDARVLKARGQVLAGFRCLLAGLRRAEESVTGGEAWAECLLDAYRRETDRYRVARHRRDEDHF